MGIWNDFKYKCALKFIADNHMEGIWAENYIEHLDTYKKDRARDVKRNGIRKQHLLFKRKTIEPFREEDIQVGNKVNILR